MDLLLLPLQAIIFLSFCYVHGSITCHMNIISFILHVNPLSKINISAFYPCPNYHFERMAGLPFHCLNVDDQVLNSDMCHQKAWTPSYY